MHAEAGVADAKNGFEIIFSQPEVTVNEEILCQAKIGRFDVHSWTIAVMALVRSGREDIVVAIHAAFENLPELRNRDSSPSGRTTVVKQVDIGRCRNGWVEHLDARTS